MQHRDILKDQIEQMGKVLAKILAEFFGRKSRDHASEAVEVTDRRLQSELDIDVEKISTLTKNELMAHLTDRHFTAP